MKTEGTKLIGRVGDQLQAIGARFTGLRMKVAMPAHRDEAIRQLSLMNSQLDCIRDQRGTAKQFAAVLQVKGGDPGIVALIIAPTRIKLKKRLANWARWDADCDIEGRVSDPVALKTLEACYDLTYLHALE